MHRWYQPTGPLCSQMTLSKVLNWHGFLWGCSVDRTWATACRRGDQGALSLTKASLLNIVGPSLSLCVCMCARTGLTGCLSQLHSNHDTSYRRGFRLHPPFSADWKQIEHKNHKSPVQTKQVSARVSRLKPETSLRWATMREKTAPGTLLWPASGRTRRADGLPARVTINCILQALNGLHIRSFHLPVPTFSEGMNGGKTL